VRCGCTVGTGPIGGSFGSVGSTFFFSRCFFLSVVVRVVVVRSVVVFAVVVGVVATGSAVTLAAAYPIWMSVRQASRCDRRSA